MAKHLKDWFIVLSGISNLIKIGTVFQVSIAVQVQFCDNWQSGIHDAIIYAAVHSHSSA